MKNQRPYGLYLFLAGCLAFVALCTIDLFNQFGVLHQMLDEQRAAFTPADAGLIPSQP